MNATTCQDHARPSGELGTVSCRCGYVGVAVAKPLDASGDVECPVCGQAAQLEVFETYATPSGVYVAA